MVVIADGWTGAHLTICLLRSCIHRLRRLLVLVLVLLDAQVMLEPAEVNPVVIAAGLVPAAVVIAAGVTVATVATVEGLEATTRW